MKVIVLAFVVFATVGVHSLSEVAPEIEPVPGGKSGSGYTTTYWDCCKPSCSWRSNIQTPTMTPIRSCAIDGKTVVDVLTETGCAGGSAYACSNQVSTVINSTLAYGFAATSFIGGMDNSLCCACMLLSFTGEKLAGKKMVVQVINTGTDEHKNQFDLATPGGGVGIYNACTKQWNAPQDGWGDRYGGIHTIEECDQLPEVLQAGCRFRFEFLDGHNNPEVTFYQVKCPAEIVALTNCDL